MPKTFFDPNGAYYETVTDISARAGHTVAPKKPGTDYVWDGTQWVYSPPPAPTATELDAIADDFVARVFEQQKDATRAMGETLAEVIFRISNNDVPMGITEAQARQWVKSTFLAKYRALLE